MSDLSFARPWILALLALVPLVLGLWTYMAYRGAERAAAISRSSPGGPRYSAAVLLAISASLAIVAAAQPRWGTTRTPVPRTGADLIVVMDVSRSMAARDVETSRLDAAKATVGATIDRMRGDRVGLVIFGGNARLRFPLTTDLVAARQVVDSLETGAVIVQGGSSAAAGLDIAIDSFDDESEAGRVILLVTDGDDLGADPVAVANRLREARIDFLVLGIGTAEGGTVPVYDTATKGFTDKLDANGKPIVTRLNETFLRALAIAAGGRYLGSDPAAVPGAVSGRLSALERFRIEERSTDVPIERFPWFAGAALAALVLASVAERLPRMRVRNPAIAVTAVLAALLLASCASKVHGVNEDGLDAYRAGNYERAIESFIEAQQLQPDDPQISLNLAAALHAAKRYDEAILAARRALSSVDPDERARAYASIGHHEFFAKRPEGALDAFKRALLENPDDETSRRDYEVVLRSLKRPDGEQPSGPGSDGTPGTGGTPDPNATPEPGQGDGPPGTGTPDPNAPSRPGSPEALERLLDQLDAQIQQLLQEAGDEPTAAEAFRILELLAERARITAVRDALAGGGNPGDY